MSRTTTKLIIALVALCVFVPFLGGVHLFDWDEINFAEAAREMLVTGKYLSVTINYVPFMQKPPLFFWLQALAMSIFGVGEFAARLPNAVCGAITLVLLYDLGQKLYDHRFGLLWALAYFGSVLPFLYFKSGIIDPYFNLFIFLGIYLTVLFHWKKSGMALPLRFNQWWYLVLGGVCIGLGILTKGPVAYLIASLTFGVYWIYQRLRFYINVPEFLVFTLAAFGVTMVWFGIEIATNGTTFVEAFIRYQYRLLSTPDAGHGGFPGYHFAVLLIGCFPASVFALRAFFALPPESRDYQRDFRLWMKFLFWVVLILFSIVQSKIVHYSSLAYFPLTFLAALVIDKLISGAIKLPRWMIPLAWGIGGLYVFLTLLLPLLGPQAGVLAPLFDDPFARGNLEAEINWTGLEVIPGLFLLGVLILALGRLRREQIRSGMQWLFLGTGVFVFLTLVFFIKRVEGYSQRAAIEFFENLQEDDVYTLTTGYKSFAPYFYARTRPSERKMQYPDKTEERNWLLTGDIDKPVYIATKIHKADELRAVPGMEELYSKNGFVFFRRAVE